MFTGIVEEIGEIVAADTTAGTTRLRVRAPAVTDGARHGESIAVNGVCLTVVHAADGCFEVDMVAETSARSSLSAAGAGTRVNCERALALGDRLGGHIVQGHVDGTAVLRARDDTGRTVFALAPELARYLVEKGSVTVDGVSLTVVDAERDSFSVALIPTTLADTTLGDLAVGTTVNIEVDVLAKYVHRMAAPYLPGSASAGDDAAGKPLAGYPGAGETVAATREELR